jgi:hypothetical protein
MLAAFGIPAADIATMVFNPMTGRHIGETTLRIHFKRELETGEIKANAKVAGVLFKKATQKECSGPSVAAAIFWLKTRARWRETSRIEHTGADGGQIESKASFEETNLSSLSDEELKTLHALHEKIRAT